MSAKTSVREPQLNYCVGIHSLACNVLRMFTLDASVAVLASNKRKYFG